ncbi:MAG TPA: HAD family phosphatase [Marinilabiliaceae bacterium]|nr:HAD family phosphatase [Marinilabiliaceae bacterium]
MNLKAVLFDMDGVIVNTEPLHKKSYFKTFDEIGIEVSEELYSSLTGRATLKICEILCEKYQLKESPRDLLSKKQKHFEEVFKNDNDLSLIDGVRELIQDYTENGLTLVLASSASMENIDRIFKKFELDPYFKAKISGADLKASKPHPEIFVRAAELAGQPKENCMVIEDSTNGIAAAHAANIFCVGYKESENSTQDYSKADKVIRNLNEIKYSKLKTLF